MFVILTEKLSGTDTDFCMSSSKSSLCPLNGKLNTNSAQLPHFFSHSQKITST